MQGKRFSGRNVSQIRHLLPGWGHFPLATAEKGSSGLGHKKTRQEIRPGSGYAWLAWLRHTSNVSDINPMSMSSCIRGEILASLHIRRRVLHSSPSGNFPVSAIPKSPCRIILTFVSQEGDHGPGSLLPGPRTAGCREKTAKQAGAL